MRLARRSVACAWVALFACLLVTMALPHAATQTGRTVFIIRGGSMEPTIPLGSLIAVARVDPAGIGIGDLATVRADNGVVYTHRITRVVDTGHERRFELKGDANESPDGRLVPSGAVLGRVDFHVPIAGYLIALLSLPSGVLSVMSLLGSLMLAIWLLEDIERAPERAAPAPGLEPDAHVV